MKIKNLFIATAVLAFGTVACQKTESKTPAEMLEGKWVIDQAEVLGITASGDGSYITFDPCDAAGLCVGSDYSADDSVSGPLSYVLNEEGTILTITDTVSDGDNWDATWDVITLTDNSLTMITESIFGTIRYEFDKE